MSNYFEDQIQQGKPVFPPVADTAPAQQPAEQPAEQVQADEDGWKGLPVRAGGDRIFLLKNGTRRWITSKEVYEGLGFNFGDEVKLDQATLNVIPEDEPIR